MKTANHPDVIIVREALTERQSLHPEDRTEYPIPDIARKSYIAAAHWVVGCCWQDHPVMLMLSIVGGVVGFTQVIISHFPK